jgi:hypothetical protein
MTERNGKSHHYTQPAYPTTLVTAHAIYAAAALQGMLSNPNILHDTEKTTACAERYAERMEQRDLERKVWER